ncbi:hypothetical protein [Bacillus sp. FSL K6-3431]|uniref:hypothetical protein n=1 Tax=Bacillus sp. FSL K6-3431 TaxID=2921500 RepID=UPI0030F5000E
MEQFLLFVIIGIISLVLKGKKAKPEQEQRSPAQRQSTIQPTHSNMEQRRDINRTPATPSSAHGADRQFQRLEEIAENLLTKAKPKIINKQEELHLEMEEMKRKEEINRTKATNVRAVHSSNGHKTEQEVSIPFQSKDILNGIIMAEVLGPPRSKKPYRRRY